MANRTHTLQHPIEVDSREVLRAARSAWPSVHVPEEVFAEYVALRVKETIGSAHLSDLYLACACALGDAQAIERFSQHFLSDLHHVLAPLSSDAAFVDEVRQMLLEKLFTANGTGHPRIARYRGAGSLLSWTRSIAIRTALNLLRSKGQSAALAHHAETSVYGGLRDPELELIRSKYADDFNRALAASIAELSPRDRMLLRLHYAGQLSLEELAKMYGVHRSSMGRWIAAARERIEGNTRRRLSSRFRLSASQFESMVRVVGSVLELPTL